MATTVQIQQRVPAVNVIAEQRRAPTNLCYIKGMAITQLVIGALTVVFGIATAAAIPHYSWMRDSGSGIWGGIWITVTGIIGVLSAWNWKNRCLEGVYLAFSIISTVTCFVTGIIYIVAVAWYSWARFCTHYWDGWRYKEGYCDTDGSALGLHVVLMILANTEFFISIVASCINCANSCCVGNHNTTVVFQPQPQIAMITTTTPTAPMTTYYQQPMMVQPQPQTQLQPPPPMYTPQKPTNVVYPQQTNPAYPPPTSPYHTQASNQVFYPTPSPY